MYVCGDRAVIHGSSANVTFLCDDPGATFACKLNGRNIRQCKYVAMYIKSVCIVTPQLVIKTLVALYNGIH